MKKIIPAFSILFFLFIFSSCGGGGEQSTSADESSNLISEVCARLLCQEAAPVNHLSVLRCGKITSCTTTCEECTYNGSYSGDCATLAITVSGEGVCSNTTLEVSADFPQDNPDVNANQEEDHEE